MGVMGSVPEDQESHSPSNSPGSNSSPHSPGRLPRPRSSRAYPTFTSNLTPSDVRMAESGFIDVERRKAEGTAIRMVQKYLESDSYTTATAWTSQLTTKSKTESTPPCSPGIVRRSLCFLSCLSRFVPYVVAPPSFPICLSRVFPFRPQPQLGASYNIS